MKKVSFPICLLFLGLTFYGAFFLDTSKTVPETVSAQECWEVQPEQTVAKEPLQKKNTGYVYTQLSDTEQQLYTDILNVLEAQKTNVAITAASQQAVDKVFQCVMDDHPEIFYADGYRLRIYTDASGETIKKTLFSGKYIYSAEDVAARREQIAAKTAEILSGLPVDGDVYQKVKYIYEYLIRTTEYAQDSADNQNICSVFLNGKSVCQGYAKAAQYLFDKAGIESTFVRGQDLNGQDHAWNLVKTESSWYHVDVTWGDASYVGREDGFERNAFMPQINYEYLCVTDEDILRSHRIKSTVSLPVCDCRADNYFVREDAYFENVDMEKVKALFERAAGKKPFYVTLQCGDDAIYAEMEQKLIAGQQVFSFLPKGNSGVAYTCDPLQRCLSFWLQD